MPMAHSCLSVKPVQDLVDGAADRVQMSVRDIRIWMKNNFLKLNDTKTEVLAFLAPGNKRLGSGFQGSGSVMS